MYNPHVSLYDSFQIGQPYWKEVGHCEGESSSLYLRFSSKINSALIFILKLLFNQKYCNCDINVLDRYLNICSEILQF